MSSTTIPAGPAPDHTTKFSLADVLAHPVSTSAEELTFAPDPLGPGFGVHYISLGSDPDGESDIRAALVRYRPDATSSGVGVTDSEVRPEDARDPAAPEGDDFFRRPALLFVHGMTDYFLHRHVAEFFHGHGYAVYGLDMRKCGRAWREGQTWHHVTDQALYDEDLTIALSLLAAAHGGVVVCGHSTGGLTVATWAGRLNAAAQAHATGPEATLHSHLAGVVLNSPWLGLQLDPVSSAVARYVFPQLIRVRPTLPLPGGINPAYGRSLHASERGEWDYDLELKPLAPRPKFVSWLVGVVREQQKFQRSPMDTGVPTFMLTSDKHNLSRRPGKDTFAADLVLKPHQMWEQVRHVAPAAEIAVIPGGLHDVFLSRRRVRDHALSEMLAWLRDVAPAPEPR